MKLSYTAVGLLIGLFLGSLVGLGESNYTKKSIRENTVPFLTIAGVLFGGIIGAYFGHKLGVKSYIEETTGIANSRTTLQKDGRYWFAETCWTDTRNIEVLNLLETKRIGQKQIVSILNSSQICTHSTESASQESINKCHNNIKQIVFSKISETFDEKTPKNLVTLFE
jgi:hypothetical protein